MLKMHINSWCWTKIVVVNKVLYVHVNAYKKWYIVTYILIIHFGLFLLLSWTEDMYNV